MFSKKSITLIELLISISLLGLIVLGVSAFDVASRKFLSSSERKTKVLNEATYALEHLDKNISIATSNLSQKPIALNPSPCSSGRCTITIYQDKNNPPTPGDLNDDTLFEYVFDDSANNHSIIFNDILLTSRLVSYSLTVPANNSNTLQINNLTLRYDPQKPANSTTNPEVTLSNITLSTLAAPAQQ